MASTVLGEARPQVEPATVIRGPGRPPKHMEPIPRPPRRAQLGESMAPSRASDLRALDARRIWIIDPDLFLVERDKPSDVAQPMCVSVLWGMDQVLRCTCPSGLQRIGCDHLRAVGERLAVRSDRRYRGTSGSSGEGSSRTVPPSVRIA